jgi:hypothetical protein
MLSLSHTFRRLATVLSVACLVAAFGCRDGSSSPSEPANTKQTNQPASEAADERPSTGASAPSDRAAEPGVTDLSGTSESGVTYADDVYRLGDSPDGDVRVTRDRIVASGDTADMLSRRSEGDVLVAGESDATRVVTSMHRTDDGDLVVETERATLTDVVRRANLRIGGEGKAKRARRSPGSDDDVRTARNQLVEFSTGEAGRMAFERDLSNTLNYQGATLEMSGRLKMKGSYNITIQIRPQGIAGFNFIVSGNPQIDAEWRVEPTGNTPNMPGGVQRVQLFECGSGDQCYQETSTILPGFDFTVRSRAELSYQLSSKTEDAYTVGYESHPSRRYVMSAVRYDGATGKGWRSGWRSKFDAVAKSPDPSGPVQSELDTELNLAFDLLVNGKRAATASPLQVDYEADLDVSPPACLVQQEAIARGELLHSTTSDDILCRKDSKHCASRVDLYERRAFSTNSPVQNDLSACTAASAPECRTDNDCRADRSCVNGQCLFEAPIYIILDWSGETNLELVVEDDDGRRLKTLNEYRPRFTPDGWLGATSKGGTGTRNREIAVVRKIRKNGKLKFHVEAANEIDADERVNYDLQIRHVGRYDGTRTLEGTLVNSDRSVEYEYLSTRRERAPAP